MHGVAVYGVNEVCTGNEWRVRKGIHGGINKGQVWIGIRRGFTARSGAGW